MLKSSLSKRVLVVLAAVWALSSSQNAKAENLYEDSYVSLGAGIVTHFFKSDDDFRTVTTYSGNTEKITWVAGFDLNGEVMLNKAFGLNLPVGLGSGYRFQMMEASVEVGSTTTEETTVNLMNNIAFMNVYLPLGSEKYWLIGGTFGIGASKYTVKVDYSDRRFSDEKESSNGVVVPLGVFFDWGADGFGGRIGYNYVLSKYSKIEEAKPKGDGSQYYIELRYAI